MRFFSGTFVIIMDPAVSHHARLGLVIKGLLDAAGWSFLYVPSLMVIISAADARYSSGKPLAGKDTKLVYRCACTAESLLDARRLIVERQACGGTVEVSVEEDYSHPLNRGQQGVLVQGQKVVVEVRHGEMVRHT